MIERRTRRSPAPVEALGMFLESQRGALEARGLVVTTRQGRVLASAGPSPEQLARTALQVHEAREDESGRTPNVATWWLRVDGVEVIVASRGGRLSHDLGSGVRRILTTAAP